MLLVSPNGKKIDWRKAAALVLAGVILVGVGATYSAKAYLQEINFGFRFISPTVEYGSDIHGFEVNGDPSWWERFVRFEQVLFIHSALEAADIWVVTDGGIGVAPLASVNLAAINARPVAGENFTGGRREILLRLVRRPGKRESRDEHGVIEVHLRLLFLRAVIKSEGRLGGF